MESFVPFGGLLSTVYEPKGLFSSVYSPVFRYEHCSGKYEQEVVPIIDRSASVDDPKIGNMPCWMHKASMVSLNDEHKVPKVCFQVVHYFHILMWTWITSFYYLFK